MDHNSARRMTTSLLYEAFSATSHVLRMQNLRITNSDTTAKQNCQTYEYWNTYSYYRQTPQPGGTLCGRAVARANEAPSPASSRHR
eukprot:scaffold257578_cov20-Prasinocladus_malaysianus.AAC.1